MYHASYTLNLLLSDYNNFGHLLTFPVGDRFVDVVFHHIKTPFFFYLETLLTTV